MAPLFEAAPKATKNPASVSGAGFFRSIQVCFWLPGHAPSARTSAGNKENKYEDESEDRVNPGYAAELQRAIDRDQAIGVASVAVDVALRHGSKVIAGL